MNKKSHSFKEDPTPPPDPDLVLGPSIHIICYKANHYKQTNKQITPFKEKPTADPDPDMIYQ